MRALSTLVKIAIVSVLLGAAQSVIGYLTTSPYEGRKGIEFGEAYSSRRSTTIDFQLWYPAKPSGRKVAVGESAIFRGENAGRNAIPEVGQFPLVVISHGGGGNGGQFAWLASALVDAGYAVALPNHPGSTTGNASPIEAAKVWERPADVSAVLDMILKNPDKYPFIDATRIGALGFSAGGYTAMALAGANINPSRLRDFCDDGQTGMSDCAFLKNGNVNLHTMDLSHAGNSNRDDRISTVIAIDPGIVNALDAASLSEIKTPVLIINLGDPDKIPRGVNAKSAADEIPGAAYQTVSDAIHFSVLAECKDNGAAILSKEGEPDPLCSDGITRTRADIHLEVEDNVVKYFDRKLKNDCVPLSSRDRTNH